MSRQRWSIGLVAVAGMGVALVASAQAPPVAGKAAADAAGKSPDEVNKWMQSKLTSSQAIFAALTTGDAKAIETNARRMLLLNVMEQWKSNRPYMDHTDYEAQLNAFEYAVKELARTGREKDIDGALDAYVMLSKSCVKCHQTVRDTPIAEKK